MMNCEKCGRCIPNDGKFCPYCGETVTLIEPYKDNNNSPNNTGTYQNSSYKQYPTPTIAQPSVQYQPVISYQPSKPWGKIIFIGLIVTIILIMVVYTFCTMGPAIMASISGNKSNTASLANAPEISLSEYYKIETGMTYDDAVKTIGSPGTELSSTDVAGYKTIIISWKGSGVVGANANVTFQNGKVIAKAQYGLK